MNALDTGAQGGWNPLLLFCLVLLVWVVILAVILFMEISNRKKLEERVSRLTEGADGENLENALLKVFDEYSDLHRVLARNQQAINDIYDRMRTMVQKVGVVKYDAFSQMGGQLSSAIAMLDDNNDGFIINTVQSVDGCYSYVKTVHDGTAEIDLGKEEDEALRMALSR